MVMILNKRWMILGLLLALTLLAPGRSGAAAAAHQLSLYYNFLLEYLLTSMSAQLPDLQVVRVGFFDKLGELVSEPTGFGLSVVNSPCLTPGSPPYVCSNPDTFIFWDGIHPTEKVHTIMSQQALTELAK